MTASLRNIFGKLRHDWLGQLLIALVSFCIIGDFFIIRAGYFNGDDVYAYNELTAFLQGDFLLHSWSLATDNFYLSDLPPYLLGDAIFGRTVSLIWLTPYFVFLFFLAVCLYLIWQTGQTTRQRQLGGIAVILLLGLPFTDAQSILRVSTSHAAVIAYSILGFALVQQILTKPNGRFWWLAAFSLVTFIVTASDPQVDLYFVLPLIALICLRFWLFARMPSVEILLLGNVVISAACGAAFPCILSHLGGFHNASNVSNNFVSSIPALIFNVLLLDHHLLASFDALPSSLKGIAAAPLIALSRFAVFLVVITLNAKIFWHVPRARDDLVRKFLAQWLLMGAVILSTAIIMSQLFTDNSYSPVSTQPIFIFRYVTPIYIYLALAAIIEGQADLAASISKSRQARLYIIAALASALFLFGAGQAIIKAASRPAYVTIAPQCAITNWLAFHNLNYGVGDYWTTQMVTALSSGKVIADPVIMQTTLRPYLWENDIANLQAHRRPQFVVFTIVNTANITLQDVTNTYGAPASVTNLNGYIIAVLKPPA